MLTNNNITNKSYLSMDFFKGSLVTYGGCEMNVKCYSSVNEMNLGNPCPNNCSGNGHCENKVGCVCKPNFILNDCSHKAICQDNCNDNGSCGSNLRCNCYPGWGSSTCDSMINCPKNCTSIENGVCQSDNSCKCNKNYSGKDCGVNTSANKLDPISQIIANNDNALNKQITDMQKNLGIKVQAKKITCKNNCSNHGQCNTLIEECECDVYIFYLIFRKDILVMIAPLYLLK